MKCSQPENLDPLRVIEGLPAVGQGGTVDVLVVTKGRVHHKLADPARIMLPDDACDPMHEKTLRVWATHSQWVQISRVMLKAGIGRVVSAAAVAT